MKTSRPKSQKSNAEARLREALYHWQKAAASYGAPEDFRISLNACIQALRNVTFALQKEKGKIPHFDTWYALWQEYLRNDLIMAWCVSARNRIVKEGDLEAASVARVSLVCSYLDRPENEFQVNPSVPNEMLARDMAAKLLPSEFKKYGYLRVERLWTVPELQGTELLEALAHAFSLLSSLVKDRSAQVGPSSLDPEDPETAQETRSPRALMPRHDLFSPCMLNFSSSRVTWLKLSTGEVAYPREIKFPTKPEDAESAAKRYGLHALDIKPAGLEFVLSEAIRVFLNVAKRILSIDGHHLPLLLLFSKKRPLSLIQLEIPDHEDKLLVWETAARQIVRAKATAVIFITEVWVAPFDPSAPERRAEESPDRKEALKVFGAMKTGKELTIVVPFDRKAGTIEFGQEQTFEDVPQAFFEPVRRRWRKQSQQSR